MHSGTVLASTVKEGIKNIKKMSAEFEYVRLIFLFTFSFLAFPTDDRLSQISARSAASSSLASQILERAQKRKDFWGKA